MRNKKVAINDFQRLTPSYKEGLTHEQVEERKNQGLVNKTMLVVGKSYWEIIRTDILSFFNILLFTIAGFMIYGNVADGRADTPWYRGIFFLGVLLANIVIGLYQDLKAKSLMKKMRLITTKEVRLVRDGNVVLVKPDEIVLDDIAIFSNGEQIVSDSIIKEGGVVVNESLLTGESENVIKNVGDFIYSGTYVVSGSCHAQVEKVGKDNYVETLASKAKAFKRNPSVILKDLKRLFRVLGTIIIALFAIITITYTCLGRFSNKMDFINMISPLGSQFVAMIPAGLNLLTSVALASGVISLFKKRANVQDLYSIEMLARVDVLCADKTGTITDGTMNVKEIVAFKGNKDKQIESIVSSMLVGDDGDNATSIALKNYFVNPDSSIEIEERLAFNTDNKYSGVRFKSGVTYLIGAFEFMNLTNKEEVLIESEKYLKKGYRVLALAKGNGEFNKKKYVGQVSAVGLIVIQDHIKEDAKETFKWFKDNGVEIKVISGDNAVSVSEIASQVGIENADKFISLEGMSVEEVSAIANEYTVFGRVTPEQKEAIVIALKKNKKTVAMTGDGVNDILALKRADCSIAMESGSQAARNVSHIVLMDNNFSTMPSIVAEGRRVINNLQRTGSLFLTKTIFAVTMSVTFWLTSLFIQNVAYPFSTDTMHIWEVLGIGMSAFFIALEPNSTPIEKGFLKRILKKAIPASSVIILGTFICYLLYLFQFKGVMYTGVNDLGFNILTSKAGRYGATGMAVLTFSMLSFVMLYLTCSPLTKYRAVVVISAPVIALIVYIVIYFTKPQSNILDLDFTRLSNENLFTVFIIVASLSAISIFAYKMKHILKELKRNDQSK